MHLANGGPMVQATWIWRQNPSSTSPISTTSQTTAPLWASLMWKMGKLNQFEIVEGWNRVHNVHGGRLFVSLLCHCQNFSKFWIWMPSVRMSSFLSSHFRSHSWPATHLSSEGMWVFNPWRVCKNFLSLTIVWSLHGWPYPAMEARWVWCRNQYSSRGTEN